MHVDSAFSSPAPATTADTVDIDHELTRGFAAQLIRRKAKQIARRFAFKSLDRQELEQEMRLRLWTRFWKFDPEKAHWNAFATTVIEMAHSLPFLMEHLPSLTELSSRKDLKQLAQHLLHRTITYLEHAQPITSK